MNPEPGFQSGPGDSVDADYMVTCLLVTKSSPPVDVCGSCGVIEESSPLRGRVRPHRKYEI